MPGHRVSESQLFKLLKKREVKDGFEASEVSSQVARIVAEAWPILQHVSRSFPQYTLHDPEHSFRVAQNMARLIPDVTLARLNSVELSVLLYAAYLHDIGMASSQEEFYGWLKSPEYQAFLGSHERWAQAIRSAEFGPDDFEHFHMRMHKHRHRGPYRDFRRVSPATRDVDLRSLQDVIYTDFLRESHAARGAAFVVHHFGPNGKSDYKIRLGEVNYSEQVALVCKSHWESATSLKNDRYRRDGYIGTFPVNLQYCAVILRLADVIELDPERTPKVLLDFILLDLEHLGSPTDRVDEARMKSAEEWAKHRAVLGYKISPDEVRIEAKCAHPAIQRGLREWCDYIDKERQDCRLVVHDNRREITDDYQLRLNSEVRPDYIESDGSYVYSDFKFQLDYERIVELLMGTELWGDPAVVLRELLQNAIDACHHRAALSEQQQKSYKPKIVFRLSDPHEGSNSDLAATLTCEDNGTGMDQRIVESFLMRIGRSYYQSSEFRKQNLLFQPISHFGLGVMSYFMLTEKVSIETQRHGEGPVGQPLLVEITSSGRYVVMRLLDKPREGTAVTIALDLTNAEYFDHRLMQREYSRHKRMNEPFDEPFWVMDQAFEILQRLAVHLDIPIGFEHGHGSPITIPTGEYVLPQIEWPNLTCMKERYQEFIFAFTHEETGGLAGTFRFLFPRTDDGELSFGCAVESLFKMFIDREGDLCLTTPGYKDDSLDLDFGIKEEWKSSESRGVYRHKFKHKPPAGSENEYDSDSALLEVVKAGFRWSQDGLYVGPLAFGRPHPPEKKEDDDKRKRDVPNLFAHVPVPGLNAADIDIKGPWRVTLNVQRADFQGDAALETFSHRYYSLAAEMWKRILSTPGLFKTRASRESFVKMLLLRARWPLESQLASIVRNLPEQSEDAVSA